MNLITLENLQCTNGTILQNEEVKLIDIWINRITDRIMIKVNSSNGISMISDFSKFKEVRKYNKVHLIKIEYEWGIVKFDIDTTHSEIITYVKKIESLRGDFAKIFIRLDTGEIRDFTLKEFSCWREQYDK